MDETSGQTSKTSLDAIDNIYKTITGAGDKPGRAREFFKLIDNGVSKEINSILRKIVTTKEGTANLANVPGYSVSGKTGTAQKIENGVYTKKKINTFVSIFPSFKPKYVFLILLDEPKTNSEYVYNYRDGSNKKSKQPFETST